MERTLGPQETDDPVGSKILPSNKTTKTKVKRKSKLKKNTKKPSDMPRRPLSAYNIFFKHTRGVILAEREDESAEGDPDVPADSKGASLFAQLGRTIARRWKELPDEEMAKFKSMAEEDMKRYRKEMEEYHLNVARKTREETEALSLQKESAKQAPDDISDDDTKQAAKAAFKAGTTTSTASGLSQLELLQHERAMQARALARQNLLQFTELGSGTELHGQARLGLASDAVPGVNYEQLALQQAQLQQLQLQLQLQQRQQQQAQALGLQGLSGLGLQGHQGSLIEQLLAAQLPNPSATLSGLASGFSQRSMSNPHGNSPNYLEEALRAGGGGNREGPGGSSMTASSIQNPEYQLALLQHQQLLQAAAEQREVEQLLHRQQQQRALQQANLAGHRAGLEPSAMRAHHLQMEGEEDGDDSIDDSR